ncbi:hypothetical protein KA001_03210, partial [Patescibacteria group bacterium]|nr:hypothetical protein [Patescibacteria group bacterium]
NAKDEKGRVYRIEDELKFKNELCMGDAVTLELEGENIKSIKVAQRAKRSKIEALASKIGDDFYAISRFASHRLLNYDVVKNNIQKGFELSIIVPKTKEKDAKVVLIASVESSGVGNNIKVEYDARIIEPDDLI